MPSEGPGPGGEAAPRHSLLASFVLFMSFPYRRQVLPIEGKWCYKKDPELLDAYSAARSVPVSRLRSTCHSVDQHLSAS